MLTVCLVLQYPNDWLKKHLDIEDIAVSVTAQQSPSDSISPLVRTRALRLAILAPVFAVLADRAVAGQTTAVIDILLEPVIATVSSQQVAWLKTFAHMMPTVLAARGLCPHHRQPLACMFAVIITFLFPLLASLLDTATRSSYVPSSASEAFSHCGMPATMLQETNMHVAYAYNLT